MKERVVRFTIKCHTTTGTWADCFWAGFVIPDGMSDSEALAYPVQFLNESSRFRVKPYLSSAESAWAESVLSRAVLKRWHWATVCHVSATDEQFAAAWTNAVAGLRADSQKTEGA